MSTSRAFARIFAVGVVGLVSLRAPLASAGEGDARQEFARGVSAYDAKDYASALDAFRRAYVGKPSPGIQRNIALCLRAMHRDAEAVDTLEEMLAKGGDAIDAHTREAARKAIDEMSESLATIRVRLILQAPDARPRDGAARSESAPSVRLSVDDADVPSDKRATLRLDPGEHTIRARVDGFAEGMARITVGAGERDRLVEIPLVAIVSSASVADDGDVPPPPAVYTPDAKVAPPPDPMAQRWFAAGGITYGSETRTLGPGLGQASDGTSAPFGGLGVTLRVGWKLSRFFNVEGLGEIGSISPASTVPNGVNDLSVTTWSIAPELRFHTTGKVRFIAGAGAGLTAQRVSWQNNGTSSASGAGAIFVAEIGGQIELGRWLLEADGVTDLHPVDNATASNGETFTGSAVHRSGIRAMIGYAF